MEGGYRLNFTDHLALSLVGNPQFVVMPTQPECCGDKNDEELRIVGK